MSRSKKTRRLKGKLSIKTGSKKDYIERGMLGVIPSKNRLAKHKKTRLKSAFEKHRESEDSKEK